jgi:hypothetical protein
MLLPDPQVRMRTSRGGRRGVVGPSVPRRAGSPMPTWLCPPVHPSALHHARAQERIFALILGASRLFALWANLDSLRRHRGLCPPISPSDSALRHVELGKGFA